jgi:predicted amidophosphoribosyltransferase
LEPTHENVPEDGVGHSAPPTPTPARTRQTLPPKGACWYCDKPLDNVRRFCDKECAEAFDEDQEYTR